MLEKQVSFPVQSRLSSSHVSVYPTQYQVRFLSNQSLSLALISQKMGRWQEHIAVELRNISILSFLENVI